jgi:hypothetical protein
MVILLPATDFQHALNNGIRSVAQLAQRLHIVQVNAESARSQSPSRPLSSVVSHILTRQRPVYAVTNSIEACKMFVGNISSQIFE